MSFCVLVTLHLPESKVFEVQFVSKTQSSGLISYTTGSTTYHCVGVPPSAPTVDREVITADVTVWPSINPKAPRPALPGIIQPIVKGIPPPSDLVCCWFRCFIPVKNANIPVGIMGQYGSESDHIDS